MNVQWDNVSFQLHFDKITRPDLKLSVLGYLSRAI